MHSVFRIKEANMIPTEPARAWQDQQHRRILQCDITAFAELSETALPYLISFLQSIFPNSDTHLHDMVAIDCLLSYQARPEQYNRNKLSLFAFLKMAARRDMLNALDREARQVRRLADLEDSDLSANGSMLSDEAAMEEWLKEHTDLSLEQIFAELDGMFSPQETAVLYLMLEGERSSDVFADALGIDDLDTAVQRREVKKVKDRLIKRLQRFGQEIS
jgi:RNA polymerase sigma-70 factor (ECF subfamily)